LKRRVIEKLPLFGLALAAGLTTFLVQLRAGSLTRLEDLPVGARICNAVVSYGVYLAKTAWPSHLAVIYPHGKWPPLWQVIGTTVMLAGLTAGAMWMARRRTYLLVGWLWYLGTLMPVIGFAQSGAQAYADRFVYLPLIGIYLAIVWGASDLRPDRRYRIVAGAMVLAGLMVASFRQVSHWRNSVSLFEHAVAVTRDNAIAHDNLGLALTGEKRYDEGIAQYREAWRLNPTSTTAHGYIGTALAEQGRHAEALGYLREAARLNPKDAKHRIDLADTLTALDRLDEAVVQYREAIRLKTDVGWVHYQLAWRLAKLGRWAEAVSEYRESLRLTPDQPEALSALAWLLATCPDDAVRDGAESVRLAERASQKRAGDPSTLDVLAAAYAETGRYEDAIRTAEKARQLATSRADIEKRLALYGRRQPYRQTQP
jgi:tetratricopeptide (TPR) repeat protein